MILGLTQADGFAISMLAILALSFGTVLVILVAMLRSGEKRDAEVDRLLDEVSRDDPAPAQPAGRAQPEDEPREPWEKPGDWWRS